MSSSTFSHVFQRLQNKIRLEAPSACPQGNAALRSYLDATFSASAGEGASLMGDPAFETTFGWRQSQQSMKDLAGNLLDRKLVSILANPPKELREDYAFHLSRHPYTHQFESWRLLGVEDPCSVVISSGTGSGKTECFMIPILDKLARQITLSGSCGDGVRALFLYPLNALINSQRERLDAWTRGFDGKIRFCLYNGNTPDIVPASQMKFPNEVLSRMELRTRPPQILITNPTMLEYMLLRKDDEPILAQSRGKLEWIVIDEAHCYMGSQAAELALLLRRAQMAFGVKSENMRFIATSATIGDPEGPRAQDLKNFLANVAGISASQVELVIGERAIPDLPQAEEKALSLETLEQQAVAENKGENYAALCSSSVAKAIRAKFINENGALRLSDLRNLLKDLGQADDMETALRWLDLLSGSRSSSNEVFLPLKAHLFFRGLNGLWACADRNCPHRQPELRNDWAFGAVWTSSRKRCQCGSPVYELVTCTGCREPFLLAKKQELTDKDDLPLEYLMQAEHDLYGMDMPEEESLDDEDNLTKPGFKYEVLLTGHGKLESTLYIDKTSFQLLEWDNGNAVKVHLHEPKQDYGHLCCPVCDERPRLKRPFYDYNVIPTTYLQNTVTPILLEYAPDGEDSPNHPCRGRKLLTFSDSRQGTARTAMRLQRFSELTHIRGLLYHMALSAARGGHAEKRKQLEDEISKLESVPEIARAAVESILQARKRKLAELTGLKAIPFNDLSADLCNNQTSTFDRLYSLYGEKAPLLCGDGSGKTNFARMLVFREFGRRPARAANLETLGLMGVFYPELERIRDADVPRAFKDSGLGMEDWRNFLKICLDFIFRANGALDFSREWRKWLGMPYTHTYMLPPDAKDASKFQKWWPQCRKTVKYRLIRLLEAALDLDSDKPGAEDRINEVLRVAWNQLASSDLCSHNQDGYLLRTGSMSFAPLEKAWLCPFSLRFLDVTLAGYSPYLPREGKKMCDAPYKMPLLEKDMLFPSFVGENAMKVREWLRDNEQIRKMREAGLWFSDHDNVISLQPLFIAQEHSAQLTSGELEECATRFRLGDVNVLSCSTTMEMGIDIGGISVVGMNNVPPHSANYLQRSGRSGRRGESRSITFTMCKNNPHEMAVFADSRWAFDTPLPVPAVSLNSKIIVQRHVNSYLLTAFLKKGRQKDDEDATRMSCDAFFTGENPPELQFQNFCDALRSNSPLLEGVRQLCVNSVYQNEDPRNLARESARAMKSASERWRVEYDALCEEAERLSAEPGGKKSPALGSVENRKKRMAGEYLLKELVCQEFLPGHGFPRHIATFDTWNIVKWRANQKRKEERKERVDNPSRWRELPNRSLGMALSEYAPGNSVAINGLVYKSGGITLNWHLPVTEQEMRELQNIRSRWHCRKCGSFGTMAGRLQKDCSDCGSPLEDGSWLEYLEPAGFAVDFYSESTNDLSQGAADIRADADVRAEGKWIELGLPLAARFRCTSSGSVFYSSDGSHGLGYAVCLRCGRVESIVKKNELPEAIKKHKKLRGGRKDSDALEDNLCPACQDGQQWKIKAPLLLAAESSTDVLEIQLRKDDGAWLNDADQAFPIAVALRDALADRLGIQAEELDCAVSPRRINSRDLCQSIFIFDRNAAGYASSASKYIVQILKDARKRLLCQRNNCETACPSCILNFDLRFQSRELDRHRGLEILTPSWLDMLELKDEAKVFGQATQIETQDLIEAVLAENLLRPTAAVHIYLGQNSLWSPGDRDMRELVAMLEGRGANVSLDLEKELYESFSQDERMLLLPLLRGNVTLSLLSSFPSLPAAKLAVSIAEGDQALNWAVYDDGAQGRLVRGFTPWNMGKAEKLNLSIFQTKAANSVLSISQAETIPLKKFGAWLWSRLEKKIIESIGENPLSRRNAISQIVYSDRYCNSPLTAALLNHLLKQLKSMYGDKWGQPKIGIILANRFDTGESSSLWHNFVSPENRNSLLGRLLQEIGQTQILSREKSEMPHARILLLKFENGGSLHIFFDQGLGFLNVDKNDSADAFFPFYGSEEKQGLTLLKVNPSLQVVKWGTHIFFKLE